MKTEIDAHIVEGLIGLGYDLHIYDQSGKYPGGLDRDDFEKQEIEKTLNAPILDNKNLERCACGRVDGSHHSSCKNYKARK